MYVLLHLQSGRRYVGQSRVLKARWMQHCRKPPTRVAAYLRNHQERFCDTFRMIPLKSAISGEHAKHLERHYIQALCAREEGGFNMLEGDPKYSRIYHTLKDRGAI